MLTGRELEFNSTLDEMAESLDISPSKYKQAVERYQAVGEWLEGGEYEGCLGQPEVSPQGSFRLGTVVKPLRDGKDGNYDIDLVCRLNMPTAATSPRTLKNNIGDRLKEHGTYARMLDQEGRRCWTLNYAEEDGVGFHMDILPAVPDIDTVKRDLATQGISSRYAMHAIAITEKQDEGYSWKTGGSNPAGYAAWFEDINSPMFVKVAPTQKRLIVENQRVIFASVDDVPDALVRTPLQRAIQILKRHRDVRFLKHRWEDDKPISIIITTLAAQAYQGESDVYSALRGIIDRLASHGLLLDRRNENIDLPSRLIQRHDGQWYIPNPVNPAENFADRWNDDGNHRAEAFFQWLDWVQEDLRIGASLPRQTDMRSFFETLLRHGVSDSGKPAPQRVTVHTAVAITSPTKPWGRNA